MAPPACDHAVTSSYNAPCRRRFRVRRKGRVSVLTTISRPPGRRGWRGAAAPLTVNQRGGIGRAGGRGQGRRAGSADVVVLPPGEVGDKAPALLPDGLAGGGVGGHEGLRPGPLHPR